MRKIELGGFPHVRYNVSFVHWLAKIGRAAANAILDPISKPDFINCFYCWAWWRRPEQCVPPGDWRVWLVMAGRGFGKTRMGAEWVREIVITPGRRVALVGATMAEVRAVMVEGESGLLNHCKPSLRPAFEPSIGRLRWSNGSTAWLHSATEPDTLRGPQFHAAWCDEIAKWPRGMEAWSNLEFTMRLGDKPRIVATTTPRPVPLVRKLVREADQIAE